MTESELIEESQKLAGASKGEIAQLHHQRFPAQKPSVRGAYNPSRAEMLADLICDLAERYKGKAKP